LPANVGETTETKTLKERAEEAGFTVVEDDPETTTVVFFGAAREEEEAD
jgi:hypothetical protein